MPDKPEQGKPDLESWFLGSEQPAVEEAVTIPPVPDPPPIEPEPEPEPEPKSPGWARSAVLAAAMLAFGGAAAYHFYPSLIRHPDPVPVTPEPKPKPPDPPIPIPEPVPEPKKEEPQPPTIKVEPEPKPPRPDPRKADPPKEVTPLIERVEPPPVKPEPIPPRKEEPPRVVVVPDPAPQPPARPRLIRPDTNTIVTPPPPPVYSGPPSGVINWSGHLDKNGAVVIDGPTTQSGTVNGSLPGVPVMIDVDTKEFAIAEAPSPSNGWKRLVIRSRRKVHSVVTIRWTVVQQ